MKRAMLVLAALPFLAPRARADISDSGALLVGSTAVVQGSMTVQGSAFSVGGSTFAVAAGKVGIGTSSPDDALDVAGAVDATGGFKKSGTSGATLSCASGQVVSTPTVSGGILTGGTCSAGGGGSGETPAMVLLASGSITSAAASLSFSGLDYNADGPFRLVLVGSSTVGPYIRMQINGDTTATNYYRQLLRGNGSSTLAARANENITGQFNGSSFMFECIIGFTPGSGVNDGKPKWQCELHADISAMWLDHFGGVHNVEQSNVTSFALACDSGNCFAPGIKYFLWRHN